MNKYKDNLKALDNLRRTNKQLDDVDAALQRKYLCNKQWLKDLHHMLDDSIDKYHGIIRNLDRFLS